MTLKLNITEEDLKEQDVCADCGEHLNSNLSCNFCFDKSVSYKVNKKFKKEQGK